MKIDTEILCSFIDSELDEQTMELVRAALETDQSLRHEYEGLHKTAQLIRSLPRVSAPADLAATITAHSERGQLLGAAEEGPSRPSKFRWTLSMAASLLIGASLGILGYSNWPGPVAPSREDSSEPVVMDEVDDYRYKDSPATVLATTPSKKAPSAKSDMDYRAKAKQDSDSAGEESYAGNLPIRGSKTNFAGKGGEYFARSGPAKGSVAKSRGKADITEATDIATEGQSFKNVRKLEDLASASQTGLKEYYQEEQDALEVPAERKNISLGRQVLSNNYVNQGMAENLKFEAEPLNVKVVSRDSAKTLQFVQQWAKSNFLIDLNRASQKSNFPAYSQVVYRGQPGMNTNVDIKNSIFVRTTRRQAQDIVGQLQSQKTIVLSVSVKDEKNQLGNLAAQQSQRQSLALNKSRELSGKDFDQKAESESKKQLSQTAQGQRPKKPANGYLYELSNQTQVIALDDLVTMVVLVEDAPVTSPAPSKPSLPGSQTKPK